MNPNRQRRIVAVLGVMAAVCITGVAVHFIFASAPITEAQPKQLIFRGTEQRPIGKVAKFLFTNTRGTQVLLFSWEKESLDSNNWTPLEGVYGDIWFEYEGHTNVGNPTIKPGESLNILVLEPAADNWRLSFASSTRKSLWDELKLKLEATWKEKNPSLLWERRYFENRKTIVSDTFSKD